MQRPGGQGTAFSIDSLIGTPQPRPGHLLYTGYPMFMPYRPLVIPQALSHSPLSSGIPPLAPLASFAGRLTNTFCASLGQGVPSMVALTTTMPSFSDPPDSFYPPQELPGPRLSAADSGSRRQESPHGDELHGRDKGSEMLNFSETFQTISGELCRRDARGWGPANEVWGGGTQTRWWTRKPGGGPVRKRRKAVPPVF